MQNNSCRSYTRFLRVAASSNLVDNSALDYKDASNPGYAVFGRIVKGLDVMDAIGAVPTATQNAFADVPVTDVVVKVALRVQ